ncbi:hypothetical protein H4683_001752 [Filibacter limicola]|uniref:Plasmid pRiA4b Orf3-like domain-containing protein n=1 Tax=Sporosarcina limicola TaxID=34101 RepID=A0A927MHA4_9BACL|nr:hypothetical protein [Sporosarcina limicola]MBE1554674.1 hypothetical protein [Sporosarcina limicola]
MKAYILKRSFEDISPLIWRRVILPAGTTFNRLHETIQNVTSFQSERSSYHVEVGRNIKNVVENKALLKTSCYLEESICMIQQFSRI